MTRYKNRKTRKIKKIKGGASPEDDIKKTAIDEVNNEMSKTKKGNGTSITIDFLEKRSNDKNYGINFDKFYENININKNGINMIQSISGVEELFEIFKKEVDFAMASDADKDAKKKEMRSNYKKTKEIYIEHYDKSGNLSPNNEVPLPPNVAPTPTQEVATLEVATPEVPTPGEKEEVASEPSNEENIQETAKNSVFDAIIKESLANKIDDTNPLIEDDILNNINNEIRNLTGELKKNNNIIKEKTEEIKKLNNMNKKLQGEIKLGGNYSQSKKDAIQTGLNKTKIETNEKKIQEAVTIIAETKAKNAVVNKVLTELKSQNDYYLKLLNRAYDILTEKLKNIKLQPGKMYGVTGDGYERINANIKTVKNKIDKLEAGLVNNYFNVKKTSVGKTFKKISTFAENAKKTAKNRFNQLKNSTSETNAEQVGTQADVISPLHTNP